MNITLLYSIYRGINLWITILSANKIQLKSYTFILHSLYSLYSLYSYISDSRRTTYILDISTYILDISDSWRTRGEIICFGGLEEK